VGAGQSAAVPVRNKVLVKYSRPAAAGASTSAPTCVNNTTTTRVAATALGPTALIPFTAAGQKATH